MKLANEKLGCRLALFGIARGPGSIEKKIQEPGAAHALIAGVKRRLSDDTIIVTCDDGTMFRCSVSTLARESEPRWVLLDATGAQYIGPPVGPDRSPEAIHRQINEWWVAKKETAPPPPPPRRDEPEPR